ncbi:zinc protease [Bacteroidia bacterium]|nr:zinc protease [Bacteroidia bacterium]
MRKLPILFLLLLVLVSVSCSRYKYETVSGDPLKARIYTLDNGLKVYLSVNPEKPRIQTAVTVRVGGKNDPDETTGLAHYFEHLMFKGTKSFGTQNYDAEAPLLAEIENLFEVYRKTVDETARKSIYHQIDSISYAASKIAIPNEYDKLMSEIGASGTNAFTSMDQTTYIEDIPSNEVDNWAKIQADRFQNPILRGFHTELETVYEEKNMSLTNDSRKVYEKILSELFKHHPYGTHTVLGTANDLKNPSIINIKNYHKEWYVPNNMAICMAGDFDPDEVIATIDKYFGPMQANKDLKTLNFQPESPITQPVEAEVIGLEAENISLIWRLEGARSENSVLADLLSSVLYNGKAGLLDLNVNQQQKLLTSYAYYMEMADYGGLLMMGRPKSGQNLQDVKNVLLAEVEKLKRGEFDEELLIATINNVELALQRSLESNWDRTMMFASAFTNGVEWKDEVAKLEKMKEITKQEIVDFANANLSNNYVVVYKKEGKPNDPKISKPAITPLFANRDTASEFLKAIQANKVKPIAPVFLDYSEDMEQFTAKSNIPVLFKRNTTNDLFNLTYVFETGSNDDKILGTAVQYLKYLGTSELSAEELKQEFYKLACDYFVSVDDERMYVGIQGLSTSMTQALELFESLLEDAQPDEAILDNMKTDILKSRVDGKKNQSVNFNRLRRYGRYGKQSPSLNILSEQELKALKPQDLLAKTKSLNTLEHKVLYYGPQSKRELLQNLNDLHRTPEKLTPLAQSKVIEPLLTPTNKVLLAPYDAKQAYITLISNRGEKFDALLTPQVDLYNAYFGGGMNSIVFQEMRETRALAYSAYTDLEKPSKISKEYLYTAFIATQNDKMPDALKAFDEIINNMPESQKAFDIAKESMLTNLRTERITKSEVLWSYLRAQDLGLKVDSRKNIFEEVQKLTLPDIKAFQEKWVKGRAYTYCILGDEKELDMKVLQSYGPITRLTTEEIFGY